MKTFASLAFVLCIALTRVGHAADIQYSLPETGIHNVPSASKPGSASAAAIATHSVPGSWKEYIYKEDFMTFSMPGQPTLTTKNVTTAIGAVPIKIYIYPTPDQSGVFLVGVNVFPDVQTSASPEEIMKGAQDNIISELQAKIVSQKNLTIDGSPCLEFEFQSTKVHGIYRLCFAGKRMYQVGCLSKPGTPLVEGWDSFFASFKLLK